MTAWNAADNIHGVQLEPGARRNCPRRLGWRVMTMSETARVNRLDRMIAASRAVALVAARRGHLWTL
jgi:hypothetical protein